MQGEPAGPAPAPDPTPDDQEDMVVVLRQQMHRLKRWFAWERWLLEPRSFAPPEDSTDDDGSVN